MRLKLCVISLKDELTVLEAETSVKVENTLLRLDLSTQTGDQFSTKNGPVQTSKDEDF